MLRLMFARVRPAATPDARERPATRPCGACGLAPKIKIGPTMGRYCLFFQVRIPEDEESDGNSELRKACIKSGNHFTWPLDGLTAKDLLDYRFKHADWRLKRWALKVGMAVGVGTVAVPLALYLVGLILG